MAMVLEKGGECGFFPPAAEGLPRLLACIVRSCQGLPEAVERVKYMNFR